MGVWTTSILIVIIYQNHILTAPLNNPSAIKSDLKTKFGKIADQIVNPEWTLTNPDSKKKENDPDPSQNTANKNGENQPNENNNDNKINNSRPSFKKSSNKKKSNKRKQNNIRSNGKQRWYKLVTVDYLLGKLPEYRNYENEQNVVLVWRDGDERKIELNEHVNILSMKNLYNNQLIRKKRNYNNTFPLQNKLQTKNVKQEDSKENEKNKLNMEANTNNHNQDIERQNKKLENKQNVKKKKTYENIEKSREPNNFEKELSLIDNSEDDENSMNSKSIDNTNENMKFLKFKNSNRHKYQYVVNNKKKPINTFQNNQTYRNKLKDPTHAQQKGKKSREKFIETDRQRLNRVKEKQNSLNDIPTISRYKPEFNIKRNANIPPDIPELNKIDTLTNDINSNTDENIDNQNIEIYPLSNLNKIGHNRKSKSKKKGQQQPNQIQNTQNRNKQKLGKPLGINNINKQGSHPKTIKPNSPNKKDILIISYDKPKITTKINSNIADSMEEPDEIDILLDAQNWNSDEELQDQTNESSPSSFKTIKDIPNYNDIEDIKEKNISNNIKKQSRQKSKRLGKKQSDDNNKLPNKIKPKLNPSPKSNNKNDTGSPQKPIKNVAPNIQEIPKASHDIPKLTTEENDDKVAKTPEPDEIDILLDAQNWNSDEELQDQTNESSPSSFKTIEDIPNYNEINDIKEKDISNNIKKQSRQKSKRLGKKQSDDNNKLPNKIKPKLNPSPKSNNENDTGSPQKPIKNVAPNIQVIPKESHDIPKLTTEENDDKVAKTPEPDEIDILLDAQNWNSDEELQDQTNESSPLSFKTIEDIPNYNKINDIKEKDISNNIKKQSRPKSKTLGKKQSDDNNKLPNKIKPKLNPSPKSNNENDTGSPQKPIKNVAPNIQEIPKESHDIPKLTTEENDDKVAKTPEPDEIDILLDAQNWNSDEELQDQTNESSPSSFKTIKDIPNYNDIEDIKEKNISNNIKKQSRQKSKRLGKKQSDDNNKLPNKIKPKLNPSPKSNNKNDTGSPQKPIKNVAPNIQEIPKASHDIPKLTTEENDDKVAKTPEPDEIDILLDAQNWNSDEELQDQTNESSPSSFKTIEDIPNYNEINDIKEKDISNNIKKQSRQKSKRLGKKQSDDNNKLPNKIKPKLNPSPKSNNENDTGSPQKPIKNVAPNIQVIPKESHDIPKLTTEENDDKVAKTPEPDEIDILLDAQNWNSDEELQDQTNESSPLSFKTIEDIPNYNEINDIKEKDISNNIKKQSRPKSKTLGKKQSDDNNKLPNKIKPKLNPSPKSNNENDTGSPQKPIKNVAPNIQEIPKESHDIPKLTTEENDDKVAKTPEPDEIDILLDAQNWNSDEELQDQTNESSPSSFKTIEDIPNYNEINDIKEKDISNNIKKQSRQKSKRLGKKQSDDNNKLPNKIKPKLNPSPKSNNENDTGSPQKPIKNVAPNIQEIPKESHDIPKLTTEENDDKVAKTPEPDEIDILLDAQNWNSDEELQDQTNESSPSSFKTIEDIPNYNEINDIKEKVISNNIKKQSRQKSKRLGKKQSDDNNKLPNKIKPKLNPSPKSNNENDTGSPQKPIKNVAPNIQEIPKESHDIPKLTTEENDDKVAKTPEPDEIDILLDAQNWNSDEELQDQTNESSPSSFKTIEDIPNYNEINDIKEKDISNNIKKQSRQKSKRLGKKQSDDNNKLPNKIKPKLNPSPKSNNENDTGSPQKPIKNVAPNIQEIPKESHDIPKLTTEENDDKVAKTPEPDEIDILLDAQNWNSDEELQDQTNESSPSSFKTIEDIPNYNKINDIKEKDISNNIKKQSRQKSKRLGKKQSDDNNKLPNKIKPKLNPSPKSNNENDTGSPQKPIKNVAPNIQEIPKESHDIPKLTTEENNDKVAKTPEPDEIDILLDAQNWNSDEELQDQTNESSPSSFKTIEDIPNYNKINDIKEKDISNNIKKQSRPKSKTLGKKQSDDNKKLPNKIKPKLNPSPKSNNENDTGSPQKPIKNVAPNIQEIPKESHDIPKLTTEENDDKVAKTPEPDEIDILLDAQNWNSDEELQDQTNESSPSSFKTIEDIPNYNKINDIKEKDISNNIKKQSRQKSNRLGKKQSDDNNKLPNKIKPKLNPSPKSNNENDTGSPQKPIKNVAPNIQEIPKESHDIPKLTTEENNDKVAKTPEPDEIDILLDAQNWNSDEELQDQTNESSPSSFKTIEDIPNYNEINDIKEKDISNNIKKQSRQKSKRLGKKQSDDNNKLPNKIKPKLNPSPKSNNENDTGSPQKPIKNVAPNIQEIPKESHDIPKLTTEENDDKVAKTPEPDEIDILLDAQNWNSDEELQDQTNESSPSSFKTIEDIPNYNEINDIKEKGISNNIKKQSRPKSKRLGKKQSDDNNKLPNKIKPKLNPSPKSNNENDTGSPQKPIKNVAPNIQEIPKASHDIPKLTTEENDDKVAKTPEPDEIDILLDAQNWNSDEEREKNKSMEYTNIIIEKPHIKEESTSNKYVTPNSYSQNSSMDNSDGDIEIFEMLDDYENLDDITMDDSDLKHTNDISNIKDKQDNNLTDNNKSINNVDDNETIKPEIPDIISTLNLTDEILEDLLALNNDLSYEKRDEEKPSDKSISVEPKKDNISMSDKELSTDDKLDKDSNIETDKTIQKESQPNPFESETGKPISSDDNVNTKSIEIPIPSIPKSDKPISNTSVGNQKITDVVDKMISSPIVPAFISHIDQEGLKLPSVDSDDIPDNAMEETDDSLLNSKDDNNESIIPKDENGQNILEKNRSMANTNIIIEKPHIKEESTSKKYVIPNSYSQNSSMDNSDGDIEIFEMLDDYENLDGITMDDSDLKHTNDISNIKDKQDNNLTENNKSINNVDDNETIRPEIPDNISTLNLTDEILEDLLALNNDLSYEKRDEEKPSDKSISVEPKKDNISMSDKELSTDDKLDKDSNIETDKTIQKESQPNPFESETGKPISSDDNVNTKSIEIPIPSIPKSDKPISNTSVGNQKITDVVDKMISSPIVPALISHIDQEGLKLPSVDSDDITVNAMEETDDSLPNSKDDNIGSLIPKDENGQNILEKNRSMENTNIIIEKPHIKEESTSNKYVTPNSYSQNSSMDNSDGDIDIFEMLDDYENLDGITMDDSDLKHTNDISNIKDKEDNNLTDNNKSINNVDDNETIKPEIPDNISTLNLTDEILEDLLALNNDLSYEKRDEEKPSDKLISVEPKKDNISKSDKELSTDDKIDKDSNIETDKTIQKESQPNPFESETGKPISSDDNVNTKSIEIPIPSIPKSDKSISNTSVGNQKITDVVDKMISSPIVPAFISHIDQEGLKLPSVDSDDITVNAMEETDDSLPNSKDDNIGSLIPKDENGQNILEKNRSMENTNIIIEKPHIKEESTSNKYVTPNSYSQNSSMDNSDGDIDIFEMLDDYENLDGITMDDSDLKHTNDISNIKDKEENNLTDNNKSINNVDDNETIKPEIPDNISTLNLTDEILEDLLALNNDLSYEKRDEEKPSDKSISVEPKKDNISMSDKELSTDDKIDKDSNIETDKTIQKESQPNPFESETGKPISSDDNVNTKSIEIPIPSIPKSDKPISNTSVGNQKITDVVDKMISSPIVPAFISHIDQEGLKLPSVDSDDITVNAMEETDDSLPNSKDDNIGSLIPKDENGQNILEKNRSMENTNIIIEKPHIKEESTSNKYVTPNSYSQNSSMDNSDGDIDIFEMLDDYENLDGITMDDSDLKHTNDISNIKDKEDNNLTDNNKSINNVDDNETIKPEIPDNISTLNLTDEILEDLLALNNDLSYEKRDEEKPSDKSISVEPKKDNISMSDKELSTDDKLNKDSNIETDKTIQKESQPNPFESETGKPISSDDNVNTKSIEIPIPSIPKSDKPISNTSVGNQKITDVVDKMISSPIVPAFISHIDQEGLKFPSVDSDDITVNAMEETDDSLPNSKDDNIGSLIPKDENGQNILEKNRSMENTNIIIEKPHIKEESTSNKYVTPNSYSQNSSMDNSDGDIDIFEMLDDYENLDGITMDDSDLKHTNDISNIKDKEDNNLTDNNKSINNVDDNETIKPEIPDNISTLNLTDEILEDLLALNNDLSYEKRDEEKPSDKSISVEPKKDNISMSDKELSTDDKLNKDSNIETDKTIQKESQPNPFESETGKPISSDDNVNTKSIEIPIPSIPKSDKPISNTSVGNQKITDVVDKMISSPIVPALISHIDQEGLKLPSVDSDDITVNAMEETDDSLPNSKDDNIGSLIPKDENGQNILEKNRSMENTNIIIEKPHIKEESTSNKYVTPNSYSQNSSMDNSDGDIDIFEMLDDYENLDGITMDDSDLKHTNDISNIKDKQDNNLTENNKSINNVDDNETIKPEIPDNISTLNLTDEILEDLLALNNDLSYEKRDEEKPSDKSISVEPKKDNISMSDKELSTDDKLDKDSNIETDKTIQKESQPNPFESETGKPISSNDNVNTKSIEIKIPSIPKSDKPISNTSVGNQNITDVVDKMISSPIVPAFISHTDQEGLKLPSVDSDDIPDNAMEETDDSLLNSKDDNNESLIPKDENGQNILEKNRSMENTNIIIEKPHIKEESTSNKYVTPNSYSQNSSMDNSDGDIDIFEMLDDYENLDGITMDDSDLKHTNDISNIKDKEDNNLTDNNKSINNVDDNETIKPEIPDNISTLNLTDEILEDLLALNNDLSYEKRDEEKPSDKSISVEPKNDNISMSDKELSTDDKIDKDSNIETDKTIQKESQPNPFESETGQPISSNDNVNTKSIEIKIPSIPKSDKPISNTSVGNQNITDVVDKMISSPIVPAFISHTDQEGLKLPSVDSDDIPDNAMEETDDSLLNSKDDNNESLIPKDENGQNILEKNRSMENTNIIIEKPHIKEESTSNKYVTPNSYSQNLSMDNSDSDIEILEMLDDYENLDGMTMVDSDLKKTNDTSNIKDKQDYNLMNNNISTYNIDDNKTIKPETADSNGKLNLPDEILEDLKAFTDVSLLNSKDDNIESLIPKDDNIQNISEKNRSMENTNIIIEKPHIKEASTSNKYVTPNMYSHNLSMDNSDGDIEILDMLDDYDNLDGVIMDDSDLKKTNEKSPYIKDKQDNNLMDNNKSINNIDDNKTIKPKIADSINTLNLTDEILEDPISFNNDLSYEKRDEEKPSDKSISVEPKADNILMSDKELSTDDTVDKNCNMKDDGILLKFTPVMGIKQKNKELLRTTPSMEKHTKTETPKEFVKTKINNDTFLLANDNPKGNLYKVLDNKYYDSNHIDKLTKIINENSHNNHYPSSAETSEDNSPILSDYNLINENDNPYGYKLPKFITKYIENGNSNNLWETVLPKKNNDFSIHKDSDNYNNDINQSIDYIKDNIFSKHVNNNKNNISETETIKNIYDDKGNYTDITDIHNKMYDDFFKKIAEQLFGKIDKMYENISKLSNLSNNSTYITQHFNTRPDDPVTKKNLFMNDLPISKPINNIDESDSKINKSVETNETMINCKMNDENVIKESIKPKKDKHKKHKRRNKKKKKHLKHNKYKKKKSHKKNEKYDYDDDDDEDDDNDEADRSHNKYKIHKNNNKKDDDNKYKNKKSRKKNEVIDIDIDNNDDNGRIKKKSHKKNYIDDDEIEISRSIKTDKKKKKKIKKSISPHESNEVNNSSSLQLNSEDDDSVKGLKIKKKSKKPTKTNSTKKKKSSPKRKSKHIKHSKSMKYKSKEIPVDVSDEDLSSNKNNYNFEEIYVKSSHNNNQNNAPKEKTHRHKKRKHKKPKKPLKISKTYKYIEIPVDNEDKISDENSVNLEETYNINITNDSNELKQKRLKHKRLKKMKNIDINIVKDTDNQVLDRNTNTRHGFQFYKIYPQYRYINPFARLFYN